MIKKTEFCSVACLCVELYSLLDENHHWNSNTLDKSNAYCFSVLTKTSKIWQIWLLVIKIDAAGLSTYQHLHPLCQMEYWCLFSWGNDHRSCKSGVIIRFASLSIHFLIYKVEIIVKPDGVLWELKNTR